MAKQKHSLGYSWASRNLLLSAGARAAWAFQEKLEQSQWFSADQHRDLQFRRLSALLAHAIAKAPHYRQTFKGLDPTVPVTEEVWRGLPVVKRADLQANAAAFVASDYPVSHGKTTQSNSSGSIAQTITVLHTDLCVNWHRALTLRSQLWANNRFDRRLCALRRYAAGAADYPDGFTGARWGNDLVLPFMTGTVAGLTVATPLHHQLEWLLRQKPQILVTFPTNLAALCQYADDGKVELPLRKILTLGEAMPEGVRGAAKRTFGATIADTYSATEVGEIAIQCPESSAYHVQSESLLVEILDDDGRPCEPGETGQVVLTALHNYAMPLIRYAIGDLAIAGKPCGCGRGLPVLSAILGRHRNMMVAPDGSRFWPSFGLKSYRKLAPVTQARFIQHTPEKLEVVLVVERPLTGDEETAIRAAILQRMPARIDIEFSYAGNIPRADSGKFEEFVSRVPTPPRTAL